MIRRVGAYAAGFLVWNLIGYPLFLAAAARFSRGQTIKRTIKKGRSFRKVSVLIAAHNEAKVIRKRVKNLLEQKSSTPIEVIVVSDGSDDRTARRALRAGAIVIEQRRAGKVAALERAVATASGDVIVLTDANTHFEPGAIEALLKPLRDPSVGIAAGDLRFVNSDESASSEGEGLYWNYETWIKRNASDCGMLLMGAGGIYAVRRENWPGGIPADFADDSYVPLSLHRDGFRNIFVPEARASERAGVTMEEEWRRRVRMVAQDARVAASLGFGLPNPRTFVALGSQKVFRWLLFPLAILSTAAYFPLALRGARSIASRPLLFGIAVSGAAVNARWVARKTAAVGYLVGATAAAFAGLLQGIAGRSRATWDKAESTRE